MRSLPLALAAAACAAVVPIAAADSISYIKDGDVHLTTPDGARDHRVTTTGGYSSASQADDGRILALHGRRFHLMDRWGRVQADFSPIAAGTAGTVTVDGPFDPAISPDGTRVAYGLYLQYTHGDPSCGLPGGCWEGHLYAATGYSPATGPGDFHDPRYMPNYGWMDPSWIDDSRTLLSGPSSAYLSHVGIDVLGDDQHEATEWFSDFSDGTRNLFDGELNRQGTGAAFVANASGDALRVYHVDGPPRKDAPPQPCLNAPQRAGAWTSPSWSPDGNRLAMADDSGLYVADLPGMRSGCPDASQVKVVSVAPGGSSPDWGPADLPEPATRPVPVADPAAPAGPTTPTSGAAPTSTGVKGGTAPSDAKGASLSARAMKVGAKAIVLRVAVPAAGRLSATATRGGRTLAIAPARSVKAGSVTLTLKAKRSLPRAGKLTVRVTLKPGAGGAARTTTLKMARR
ncbi:MAG TPA: hypothetical protein VFG42_26660 [Baekduia sp.]|uniref:hypothetical protein n=1 Tax=Baekduia sp. TaxID=2600305 RepID=UPI002D795A3D|nr:hypothetical protein [Baekduia sp.]HET6510405.1 hypothetical protein [Baekduia sp.]